MSAVSAGALQAAPAFGASVVALPRPLASGDGLLGHWLALVSKNRHLRLERAARRLRLTTTEWVALRQLQQSGRTTQCQLATDAGLSAPSLSRALSALEEQGHVSRAADADDLRCIRVELTESGRALVPLLVEAERRVDRDLFGSLAQAAREELALALRAVAASDGFDEGRASKRARVA